MIYLFPNLDTFKLALTSGVVPAAVSASGALGAVDDEGQLLIVWMRPGRSERPVAHV